MIPQTKQKLQEVRGDNQSAVVLYESLLNFVVDLRTEVKFQEFFYEAKNILGSSLNPQLRHGQ